MSEPNFLIAGTCAGGTSFLSAVLVQHPQIYLPKKMRPEPHYFYKSWEYEKGLQNYLSRWFQEVPEDALAIGERSSSYLFGGKSVAKKIKAVFPKMRFIFTLRNPIERTWANYRFTVLQGLESLSFEEALATEEQRVRDQSGIWAEIQPFNYTGRGFYAEQLESYLELFPKKNILSIKSELLSRQTDIELEKIYSFLGLSLKNFNYKRAADHTAMNVVQPKLQMELRNYFGDRFDKIIEAIRKEEDIESFVLNKTDEDKIELLTGNLLLKKQPMPVSSRNYLQDLFCEDMSKLRHLVDFDISDWL